MFRHKNFLAAIFIFFSQSVHADEGKALIEKVIHKLRAHQNISEYEMTIQRPAWTRAVRMKIWDDRQNSRVFVKLLEPAKDQGTTFLRVGYNLWNYLPKVEKVLKIPPSMMLQPWMGSDFTNDDLVKESSYIEDYDHKILGEEVLDGQAVWKIELIPHPKAAVVWGKVLYWVRKKDTIPLREQFIDERGNLIKELIFSDIRTIGGVIIPGLWEMRNAREEGRRTVIKLLSVSFDPKPPIADAIFTEKNMRP